MRGCRNRFLVVCVGVLVSLYFSAPVEGRSSRVWTSPVKISDVVISPEPFLIGKGPVRFSMLVELPSPLNGANVLEVSALITSPTRRSMSFVAHRRPVSPEQFANGSSLVPVVLVWDGKDQFRNLVPDGSYYYEIRAKLMEDEGLGPRTKIVSHRIQGTLDVLAYEGEVLPPVPPEPVLPEEMPEEVPGETPEELNIPEKEEEVPAEEVPVVEEGLKAAEDPADVPKEEGPKDPEENFPEALPSIQDNTGRERVNGATIIEEALPPLSNEGTPESSTVLGNGEQPETGNPDDSSGPVQRPAEPSTAP